MRRSKVSFLAFRLRRPPRTPSECLAGADGRDDDLHGLARGIGVDLAHTNMGKVTNDGPKIND